MSNPTLYKHRDSAEQIRQQYATQVAAVQADKDLSEDGRRRRLAELYVKAKAKLDALAAAEGEQLATRKSSLERDLFGARGATRGLDAGAAAVSARDASDRAGRIESPAEALARLRQAERDGDELLARAVARRCIEASDGSMSSRAAGEWDEVTMVYLASRPSLVTVVEELAEIERLTKRQIFSPFNLMQPNGVTSDHINSAAGVSPSAKLSDSLRGA